MFGVPSGAAARSRRGSCGRGLARRRSRGRTVRSRPRRRRCRTAVRPPASGVVDGAARRARRRGTARAGRGGRAVAGRGLAGDRYFDGAGTFSGSGRGYQLTLIEAEALEACARGRLRDRLGGGPPERGHARDRAERTRRPPVPGRRGRVRRPEAGRAVLPLSGSPAPACCAASCIAAGCGRTSSPAGRSGSATRWWPSARTKFVAPRRSLSSRGRPSRAAKRSAAQPSSSSAVDVGQPGAVGMVARQIAERDRCRALARRARIRSTGASRTFATATSAGGKLVHLAVEEHASIATPLTAAFATVASTAAGSLSTARIGPNPSRAAAIDSTPEPQPDVEQRAALASLRAARRRAGWSGARRCRTPDPGRSRPRARPAPAAPTAARSRARPRGPAGGRCARHPPSPGSTVRHFDVRKPRRIGVEPRSRRRRGTA